ncbi:DoxX family protein [Haladaptatus sp. ZSTT2]|uniref:DoxX family protein n=1 Tax=Haladaptatus sp. ZSTT2 TaxID=3120515 RepID=UPI003FA606E2
MSETNTMDAELFGRSVSFDYSDHWVGYSLVILRVVMGWVLFQGGITKILDPTWSARGFLLNAIPEGNPLGGLWMTLGTDYIGLIDPLNAWGLTLAGLALMLGAFVRWSAFWGAIMMLFYWAAALQGGILAGLPIAHGWVVDDHIVYAALLFGLGAFGAGRILGVDAYLEKTTFVQNNGWVKSLLG